MKVNSKFVTSDQIDIHPDLEKVVLKNMKNIFAKPYTPFARQSYENILDRYIKGTFEKLVLDIGCGVGESTYHLAQKHSDALVIGVDKSEDRILRNNKFKKELPKNMMLVRADIIDLLRLIYQDRDQFKIAYQYILYPNPYPKQKHLKLRWYGHSLFKYMMLLNTPMEIRSNWLLYLKEFELSAKLYMALESKIEQYIPEIMITPFERKYFNSNHQLFRLLLKPVPIGK